MSLMRKLSLVELSPEFEFETLFHKKTQLLKRRFRSVSVGSKRIVFASTF